jgi:ribosome biogenesis SPOUT family RNA methylase Rps3
LKKKRITLQDIKQILKLTVLVDESHEVPKEYTYEKLQDLQSRLMLVAGEEESSKKNVERFSLVKFVKKQKKSI